MIAAHEGKDWLFVSDAHFTGRKPGEMDSFVRFLDSEKERIDHLVILGDLFEFFFGFKEASPFAEYIPVLEELQGLYRQGIRIKYFEGNHDFFIDSFFSEHLGIDVEVHPDGGDERLGERRAFVAHGDLSNPGQWRYHAFRKMIKSRWACSLIQWIGPLLSRRVAQTMSNRSYRKYHAEVPSKPVPAFKAFAHQKFLEGYEIVILGHSHFPEKMEEWIDGKRCLYFNVGDWAIHRSFLRFTPAEQFLLERFEGK